MKTTYVYKNRKPEVKEVSVEEQGMPLVENKSMVDVYLSLKDESEKTNSAEVLLKQSVESKPVEQSLGSSNKGKSTGKKKGKAVFIVLPVVIIAIGVGGFFGYKFISDKKNQENIDTLTSAVYSLYLDDTHSDVVPVTEEDLVDVFGEISIYKDKGYDMSSLEGELNAMIMFSEDKAILESISTPSTNMMSEEYRLSLDGVKSDIEGALSTYTSLAETLNKMVESLDSEYTTYTELKDKLNAVSDSSAFDKSKYDLSAVTNELNKEDLESIIKVLESEKAVAEAESELESLYEHDEEGNRVTDKKGNIIEPAEEVIAPVNEKLAAAQKANIEAIINKAVVQDKIYGTDTASAVKAQYESATQEGEESTDEAESGSIEDM